MQRESEIMEDYHMEDHFHIMISIPLKCALYQVLGSIKAKSAIHKAKKDIQCWELQFFRPGFLDHEIQCNKRSRRTGHP